MIFSCTKDNLQKGLNVVSHISNKQVNLPVLQNVHLKAEGGSIVLSTTNLEIAMRISIRGKIDKPGEFTVPAKLFYDFVSLLPNDRVDVERVDQLLEVRCGDTATTMNGIDAAEFPLIPQVETTAVIKMPAQLVREALSQVAFAVSHSEARPELSGVLLKFNEKTLTMAATDSYRLSERKVILTEPAQDRQLIIPAETVNEVNRMLSVFKDDPEADDVLELRLSDSQAVFVYGPAELITRTIDGNYPDYTQIIPTVFTTEVIVGRNELIKAIKTASLFSRQGVFDVILQISPDTKKLTVTANEVTRGTNTVSCDADITGKENKMTVNFRYLLDGLNTMSSEGVTLKLIDAMNPCLVMPNGLLEPGSQTYIVMPIRQ
ncbi:DNA polymerase III subunit beta [Candidatus Uhrbacteria bacterium CG10_big_fil_rev_8_21_14_0_10_50_16]|uniref:Beta sliding clamp n=1 Tax=Candidatus Uhrbacteria bacterium CG10_big_fil_rev_8_21_14_0_10_50_16 TaxID=1975039 RepID=A0A2H0RLJ7_9BACT|nr:MAG: DNA polymerase III subunit beta [Candidatus Uhrbacteria bacterium CG10_big_fil_rev_8_21_14_0_10_50_16]